MTTLLLNNAEPIKLACYILPLLLALGYLNKLRVDAQRQAIIADGLRLDAQRQTAIENGLRVDAQDQATIANNLRLDAQRQTAIENGLTVDAQDQASIALSRQLASESELLRSENLDIEPAALLAAESMQRSTLADNDHAIRRGCETVVAPDLAGQEWRIGHHGGVQRGWPSRSDRKR